MVHHNHLKRDQESSQRTAGGKETGKSSTLADCHGTEARQSGGAESESGIEAEKGIAIGIGSAAEGRRVRGTGRQRESDTEIKTQKRGETGRETGKETDPEILTEETMNGKEEETVTENVTVIESETRDETNPEAGNATGTEIVGKTGAGTRTRTGTGTETRRERERGTGTGNETGTKTKTGVVGTGAGAEKRERRKRIVNITHPRKVIKLQTMKRACPSLCFLDTPLQF